MVDVTTILLRNTKMKKTVIALSLAAFAFGSAAPSFAAGAKACKPAKKGYELDAKGKCVKSKAAAKKK